MSGSARGLEIRNKPLEFGVGAILIARVNTRRAQVPTGQQRIHPYASSHIKH